jgi:hypothetical protein
MIMINHFFIIHTGTYISIHILIQIFIFSIFTVTFIFVHILICIPIFFYNLYKIYIYTHILIQI